MVRLIVYQETNLVEVGGEEVSIYCPVLAHHSVIFPLESQSFFILSQGVLPVSPSLLSAFATSLPVLLVCSIIVAASFLSHRCYLK